MLYTQILRQNINKLIQAFKKMSSTHTKTIIEIISKGLYVDYIYIYKYIYMCVCVYVKAITKNNIYHKNSKNDLSMGVCINSTFKQQYYVINKLYYAKEKL